MNERGLRRLCRRLLRELDLQPPLRADELCERLGRHRGRPIVVVPTDLPGVGGFGALVPMPAKDLIVYPQQLAPAHQATIIFHEIVHLVRGHAASLPGDRLLVCGAQPEAGPEPATVYDRWQEWEAETGATILSRWAEPLRPAAPARPDASPAERTIARVLGDDWA